jgi:hypothetical protein
MQKVTADFFSFGSRVVTLFHYCSVLDYTGNCYDWSSTLYRAFHLDAPSALKILCLRYRGLQKTGITCCFLRSLAFVHYFM